MLSWKGRGWRSEYEGVVRRERGGVSRFPTCQLSGATF
jgi:hypothetical protein